MYRLYHNTLLIYSHPSEQQHRINNLQPWSLHTLRIDACTVIGCTSSNEVKARTQEEEPEGDIGLDLKVDNSREVSLKWNAVAVPNGNVSYDAYFEGLFYHDPGEKLSILLHSSICDLINAQIDVFFFIQKGIHLIFSQP